MTISFPNPIDFEVVSTEQQLLSLEPEWRALTERARDAQVFQTFDWVWPAWKCVASMRGRQLHVIVGRNEDRVVLIWPLVTYDQLGLRLARTLDSETTEYRDLIIEGSAGSREIISQAWEFVTRRCGIDAVYIQYVPASSLLDAVARRGGGITTDQEEHRYVDCREFADWSGYFRSRSTNRRSDLRRRRRRLEETGVVEVVRISTTEQLSGFLPWLFVTKIAALSGSDGPTDWFTAPQHKEFLTSLLHRGLKSGVGVATALVVDGKYIAGKVDVDFRKTKTLLITTYDRDWARFAPGVVLYEECLREAFDKGFHTVDFRIGDEPHKTNWTNRTGLVRDHWAPCTGKGRVYIAWRTSGLRKIMKRAYSRLRGVRPRV
ncbi:MAG: GNAT family N-acetyltransferase [Rhodospirillales bacterium]|nr:GNAT family N-acetyltransferase [Rhodospirillales bacterium]